MVSGIVRVALPVPLRQLFDYRLPDGRQVRPGIRVRVPFGQRKLVGIVDSTPDSTTIESDRLKSVMALLDKEPILDEEVLALCRWAARYYQHPVGEVVTAALPPALRKGGSPEDHEPLWLSLTPSGRDQLDQDMGRATRQKALVEALADGARPYAGLLDEVPGLASVSRTLEDRGWIESGHRPAQVARLSQPHTLREEQHQAVARIGADRQKFQVTLLDGITGSGKTEVYLQALADVVEDGGQVLILVPEIGLIPQLRRRLQARLGVEVAVYHSGQAAGARQQAFQAARTGRARILLGTRSAVFMPLPGLGMIIVDEEHDEAFKQQDGFRYQARDVAVKRAALNSCPVILGSATPSLESLANANAGRYRHLKLAQRSAGAALPDWETIDLEQHPPIAGGLSAPLLGAMASVLEDRDQVLLFLNRRGFAPVLFCPGCRWQAECSRCDARMTLHAGHRQLRCHHCGAGRAVPQRCPDCGEPDLAPVGEGTQQLESVLQERFPDIPVVRVDRDRITTARQLSETLESLRELRPGILVGTQMLAKGHHLPALRLAALVNCDQALFSADFRALERLGQLLVQVSGRAGRGARPGRAILQTRQSGHPLLQTLLAQGYAPFAQALLDEREQAGWPPFVHLALLRADSHQQTAVVGFLKAARQALPQVDGVDVYGPVPSLMERRAGRFRQQLVLQSSDRMALQRCLREGVPQISALKSASRTRWGVDMDPTTL